MTSQASYIAAFLFIGFIVFVTVRGELPAYKAAIFGGDVSSGTATDSPQSTAATALGILAPLATL